VAAGPRRASAPLGISAGEGVPRALLAVAVQQGLGTVLGCLRASRHAGGSGGREGVVQLAGEAAGFQEHLGADAGDAGGGGAWRCRRWSGWRCPS
jgi:hypothetical protein